EQGGVPVRHRRPLAGHRGVLRDHGRRDGGRDGAPAGDGAVHGGAPASLLPRRAGGRDRGLAAGGGGHRRGGEPLRSGGAAAGGVGAAFIREGAIPFAAADPLRVIPSMMAGGAVTGALVMALSVGSQAPHGGIFVAFAISPVWGFVLAVLAGTLVAGALVTVLKEAGQRRAGIAA